MRFSQLPERQANAIAEFYLKVAEIKAAESQDLSRSGLQMLVIGNGAGIAVLTTFMGVIVQKGESLSDLIAPLTAFLAGATVAALMYLPLIQVARDAANHIGTSVEAFFRDQYGVGGTQRIRSIKNRKRFSKRYAFVIDSVFCGWYPAMCDCIKWAHLVGAARRPCKFLSLFISSATVPAPCSY